MTNMRWMAPLLLVACSKGSLSPDEPVPEFLLPDVNETSARYATDVSPRDLLEQVSGWYFGHAT